MQKKIQDEIKRVIKSNLPSQVAGELREFFEEHNRLKKDHKSLADGLETKLEIIKEYEENVKVRDEKIKELEAQLMSDNELKGIKTSVENMRAEALKLQDQNQVNKLIYELETEKNFSKNLAEFMLNLSKNTMVKKTFSGGLLGNDFYQSEPSGASNSRSSMVHQVDQTTTVEEE